MVLPSVQIELKQLHVPVMPVRFKGKIEEVNRIPTSKMGLASAADASSNSSMASMTSL